MDWGEVNPTHAYYNGSRTSKDNEDPGWNKSFKMRRTQKTTSAVEVLWKTILRCYLYLLGTFNSDDIQAAGSDTRPPMLDRTDYESWSQRIRLYCRGKENGVYILQSIDQGPFQLGVTRDTLGFDAMSCNQLCTSRITSNDIYKLSITTMKQSNMGQCQMLLAGF
ncbi:hypothetical protein Tco_0839361 [Tanacetum coccineum]|uniref:Integrase, catalytic region, zinc finger, CCHC-type, peptidase aspartic, catalytic n=1 Tax=Tanacetum coccineum TaxID=301880 RepID=A0ABQ5AVF4_9ASTR